MPIGTNLTARPILIVFGIGLAVAARLAAQEVDPAAFFETEIRPLFVEKCSACHGEKVQMAELRLDTAAGFENGAGGRPIVVPGDPLNSRLIQAVGYEEKIKMPPTGKLSQEEISALRKWVEMGAEWPRMQQAIAKAESTDKGREDPTQTDHWSFQPVRDYAPPAVEDSAWVETDVDAFILAKLEEKGLSPARRAGKLTLLRRAKFDLHGLPPTLDEIDEFLGDESPRAFANLIERLLASPHYGERWGRHWLDVARYADSTGVDEDKPYIHAWRYRDYVVDAFNRDLPYDQFVREQIAGDLLPPPPGQDVNINGIIATGFLALGPKALAQQDKVQMVYDVVDEQISTTSQVFLGLTIGCARCHDHKFDPILTKDYYSLASIFASTRSYDNPKVDGAGFIVTPLVRNEIGERYLSQQEKIKGTKRVIDMVAGLGVADYKLKMLVPRIADFMLAARQVYEDGVPLESAAQASSLRKEMLANWVDYLRPSSEPRAHLDRWYNAADSTRARVAREYQRFFEDVERERMEGTASWLEVRESDILAGKRVRGTELGKLRREPFHTEVSDGPFKIEGEDRKKLLAEPWLTRLEALTARLKHLEETSPPEPPLACAVTEGRSVEQPVFIRGRHDNPGEIVPKQFPVVLAGHDQAPITQGSGRRELAEFLTREDNPLPARVMANRIWLWHFGEGLVRTPNNFGTVGERPTHPELLDYLARRFVESGWSVKHMHRLIMLSSTYQMGSRVSDEAWKTDSSNRLWSRFNRRRLTLEELRDGYLALSGRLDLTVGGNVEPEAANYTEFQRNNRRVDPDFTTRRTLYLPLHRNKLPTLLNLFDFGDAATSSGKRSQTNVAPQALYVMNSTFANERAGDFAERLLAQDEDRAARIERAYLMALTRKPTPAENRTVREYLARYERRQTSSADARRAAWKSFCKMLLASNEFHYVD